MILSTKEPQCLSVEPTKIGIVIDLSYTVSGINETEVKFTVSLSIDLIIVIVVVDELTTFSDRTESFLILVSFVRIHLGHASRARTPSD